MSSWPMLLALLTVVALAGVEAWRDRSARKPLAWAEFCGINRPDLTWWSRKESRRERRLASIPMRGEGNE